jgi:PAS domain S-box-containing protein
LIQIDFEALFARSPNPYVVLDPTLTIAWMNDAYLQATMREREKLIGRKMFEAFPSDPLSDSHRLLQASFSRVLETGNPDEIALIRYDIQNPDGSMDVRYWSATHTPILDDAGAVAYILQHTVDVTELHGLRRMRDEMGVVERASAVQARNLGLLEESSQLKSMFEQAPGFVAVLTGPQHRFQMANRAYRDLVGRRDLIGKGVAEALPEVLEQGFGEVLDKVRETGTAYVASNEAVQLKRLDGDRIEERYLDFIFQPIYSSGSPGEVSGIFVQGHDVTEQARSQERQKLLINELNHRVKNTLAIVQSLASQSFRAIPNSEPARRSFDARLNALAAAHTLLTASNWESARLLDTVRSSVSATAGAAADRFSIHGPDFLLQPQTAVSLAMVIHELSTNAIKHGALSNEAGKVKIDWRLEEEEDRCRLQVEWAESGGPRVTESQRRGFGTRLIERGMSAEQGSSVTLRFEPDGLHCTISALLPRGSA